ncbi:MAG: glycine--tRNA ligase [Candidatus Micrarchaeota archaeon]|nr:glycine--tRNA ligase [Candidatus Micrarchaeota archaeon]
MLKDIYQICVNRGFFIPAFEPYGQVSGFYDYGPLGVLMKNKIINIWRKLFFTDFTYELETTLINIEKMLIASGHVENFNDPIVRCEKCNTDYRADTLIEEITGKKLHSQNLDDLEKELKNNKIKCQKCNTELKDIKKFNMMFELQIGATGKQKGFLRPETAQGLFLAFPRIFKTYGSRLPLGLAQVGKSFRNEISPRQGLTRMREFTQMEIELFFDPEQKEFEPYEKIKDVKIKMLTSENQLNGSYKIEENSVDYFLKKNHIPNKIMGFFLAKEQLFYETIGINRELFWFRELLDDEKPHYSGGNVDVEVKIDQNIVLETIGNAYRTDYDLKNHQLHSKQNLEVYIEERKVKLIPHVVEPSIGFDRTFYSLLHHCFRESSSEKAWDWFAFPFDICPYQVAVFPLMKKDNLDVKAYAVYELIKDYFSCYYSATGNIGKRYARADEIGTYYAVTIDYQTLEDDTVTLRFRDTGKQTRHKISDLIQVIGQSSKLKI